MSEFELEDKDCAIILKVDSSIEIILPKIEDENEEVTDNMLVAVGIVTLLPTPGFQELMSKFTTENLNKINEEREIKP